ncbi:MAG: hypothetical protein ACRCYZ_02505 [Alphaproteobacteria bacterium]
MKSIKLFFLAAGVACLTSHGWANPLTNFSEEVRASVDIKFSKAGDDKPLDEKHPAIRAANKIENPQDRKTALKLSHVFREKINSIVNWLLFRVIHADNIFSTWKTMTPPFLHLVNYGGKKFLILKHYPPI